MLKQFISRLKKYINADDLNWTAMNKENLQYIKESIPKTEVKNMMSDRRFLPFGIGAVIIALIDNIFLMRINKLGARLLLMGLMIILTGMSVWYQHRERKYLFAVFAGLICCIASGIIIVLSV